MKKGEHFSAKGVAKKARTPSGKEKEDWRDFSKIGCQVLLSKEVVLGHPCVPRVRVVSVIRVRVIRRVASLY